LISPALFSIDWWPHCRDFVLLRHRHSFWEVMRGSLLMRTPHPISGPASTSARFGFEDATSAVLPLPPQTQAGGPIEHAAPSTSLESTRETGTCPRSEPAPFRPISRSPRLPFRRIMAYPFVGALLASCAAHTDAEELRTYSNDAAGYTVTYPTSWYASPPFYANAFEIRNYDASHAVPEKDQASIITTQEAAVSAEQADRRIQNLLSAAAKGRDFHLEKLPIERHLLYQWTVIERPAVPAGHPTKEKPMPSAKMRMRVASAVVLGAQIVRMEGKAWEDADPRVISAMKEITRSIRPASKKGETK